MNAKSNVFITCDITEEEVVTQTAVTNKQQTIKIHDITVC